MLRLPDSWVWDFWFADDGERFHLFFLYASRPLHDPERRHYRAQIGHAVSADLRTFERVGTEPLLAADPARHEVLADGTWHDEAFRDPWVLPDPDGEGWHMLITAPSREQSIPVDDRGIIAHATSPDLVE